LQFPEVTVTLVEIERFREHLALLDCPSCGEKALKLVSYVQGPTGWSSTFFCVTCDTRGELNSDGFRVELTEAKLEVVDEEPKPKQRKESK
jgi:hypothetical protein